MMMPTLHEQILTEIKRCNTINKHIWSKVLIDTLNSSRNDIMRVINTLIEFDMVVGRWADAYNEVDIVHYTYYITDIGNDYLISVNKYIPKQHQDKIEYKIYKPKWDMINR